MKCPNCRAELTIEHLRKSPACMAKAQSIAGVARLALRQTVTRAGGRPPIETPCPKCGRMCESARAARAHCRGARNT